MAKFSVESLPSLQGKVFIVTGGNNGIGHSTVAGLLSKGARVYMASRSQQRAEAAMDGLKQRFPGADVRFLPLDNKSFASVLAAVRSFTAQETQLHGLINNAGVMGAAFEITADGFEGQFQVNYLSHWLLTYHLLPLLQSTAAAAASKPGAVRIVNLTSSGHSLFEAPGGIHFADTAVPDMSGRTRYGQSKLANVLHTRYLNTLYGPGQSTSKAEIWSAAVHPGVVKTNLLADADSFGPVCIRNAITNFGIYTGLVASEETGALYSLWAAASPDFPRSASGGYVVPYAKMGKASSYGRDDQLAEKLWKWTEEQLGSKGLLTL